MSIIAAVSENNVIGYKGKMPWHIGNDLKRFKKLTMGHWVIMGRRTYVSLENNLPGRKLIILSGNKNLYIPGCEVFSSVDEVLNFCDKYKKEEVFVAGGESLYKEFLPFSYRIYLTRVHAEVPGDTFFNDLDLSQWLVKSIENHEADDYNEYPYSFINYERIL